jgi:arylsulfatase A-like enzyme
MNKNKLLLPFLPVFVCLILVTGCSGMNGGVERPNVILIYLDDLDNSMLGCYGGDVRTPNIDRIADDGMKFTRYYPSSAVCTPSRYSLLTGKYASRSTSETFLKDSPLNGQAFVRWNTDISQADLTIAEALKSRGYRTGFVGKWHLGFPNYDPLAIPYDSDPEDPEIKTFLEDNYNRTLDYVKRISGFDEILSFYSINMRWIPVPRSLDHHNQEWIDRGAMDFIERNKENPFFLYVATTLPHSPSAIGSLMNRAATPLGYYELDEEEKLFREETLSEIEELTENFDRESYASARWIDHGVGKILDLLKELELEENTLIIVASDNDNRGKMTCYNNSVPFLMQWKGRIAEGFICDELVSNIDIAPTVYDICETDTPGEELIDGMSLRPLINGDTDNWRSSLFREVVYTRGIITKDWNYVAVRYPDSIMDKITTASRKEFNQEGTRESANDGISTGVRVRYNSDKTFPAYYDFDQLYDLVNDPGEQRNLAYDKNYALKLVRMKKLMRIYSSGLPHKFGEFK